MKENKIEDLLNNILQDKNLRGDSFIWANWMSQLTITTCQFCVEQHGKIFAISILENKNWWIQLVELKNSRRNSI